ncbi:hypothetical protein [Polaromonas sp.]
MGLPIVASCAIAPDKLRTHHLLGHIDAHERVSEESARTLML